MEFFLSIYKSEHRFDSDFLSALQASLYKGGYAVDSNVAKSSRTVLKEAAVAARLKNNDAYVLVIDRATTPKMLDSARLELQLARNLSLPVFIFHNFQDTQPDDWKEKLELSTEEMMGLAKYKDAQRLAADLIPALNNFVMRSLSTGWIRYTDFEAIKSCIEKINHHRSLLDSVRAAVE